MRPCGSSSSARATDAETDASAFGVRNRTSSTTKRSTYPTVLSQASLRISLKASPLHEVSQVRLACVGACPWPLDQAAMTHDPNDLSAFKGPDVLRGVFRSVPSEGGIGRKKPSKNKRTAASPKRIKEIRAKKCGECRLCGKRRDVNAHHLIAKSLQGIWTESNIVGLCGSGNTGCHGLIEAYDKAACYLLRALLTDAEYSYVVSKMGEGWLDQRYPVGKVA